MRKSRRYVAQVAVALASLLTASCAGSVPVYPVNVQILVDDKPVRGLSIDLIPAAPSEEVAKWMMRCAVAETGELVVRTYRLPRGDDPRPGAVAGEYIVTVSWPRERPDGSQGEDRLKDRYSDPKTSPLRLTVKPGANDLEPIRLTTE